MPFAQVANEYITIFHGKRDAGVPSLSLVANQKKMYAHFLIQIIYVSFEPSFPFRIRSGSPKLNFNIFSLVACGNRMIDGFGTLYVRAYFPSEIRGFGDEPQAAASLVIINLIQR